MYSGSLAHVRVLVALNFQHRNFTHLKPEKQMQLNVAICLALNVAHSPCSLSLSHCLTLISCSTFILSHHKKLKRKEKGGVKSESGWNKSDFRPIIQYSNAIRCTKWFRSLLNVVVTLLHLLSSFKRMGRRNVFYKVTWKQNELVRTNWHKGSYSNTLLW